MIRRLALLVLGAVCLLPGAALGLGVNEVARDLKCPTCDTPLDVSNAPVAIQMKEQIATRIAQGRTKQEIIDEMVADFGRDVLAVPPKSGFDLVVWILPLALLLVGGVVVAVVARSARRNARSRAPAPPTPEESARLDDLLARTPPDSI